MTRITPSRRITLQFGQIFLTDGRTFISLSSFLSRNLFDPAPGPVSLRELDPHLVTGHQPDEVRAEAVGDMSQDHHPVLEPHPVQRVREWLDDPTAHEIGPLGHKQRLYLIP
jgi:hypothetical protein